MVMRPLAFLILIWQTSALSVPNFHGVISTHIQTEECFTAILWPQATIHTECNSVSLFKFRGLSLENLEELSS